MIPLLALSFITGATKGYAEKKRSASAAKAEKDKLEAERLYDEQVASLAHERQRDLNLQESLLRQREKEAEEAEKRKTGLLQGQTFRRIASAEPTMPLATIARETQYSGYDENAVFSARAPVFDSDGQLQYYEDGKAQMDLLQISLQKRDDANAAITQFTNKVSPKTLEWWRANNQNRYTEAVSFLTNNVAQVAKERGSSGIQGVSQGFPRVPSATVQGLITAYGPELAEQIVRDAMPFIGQDVRKYYNEVGWNLTTDAKITPKAVTNTETGETDIVPVVEEGGVHVPKIDNADGTTNFKALDDIKPITKVVGKTADKVEANIAIFAEKNGVEPLAVIDSLTKTRKVIGTSDWWLYPSAELGLFDSQDKVAYNTFVAENGLFSNLTMAESIEMTEYLAGPGITGYRYRSAEQEGIIPTSEGGSVEQFVPLERGALEKRLEVEKTRVASKYNYDPADVVNKAQAARDAIISADALIYEYKYGASVPGLAGSFATGLAGAKAQVSYFIKTITTANMPESKRQEFLSDLRGLESSLNVEGLDQIAVANRVRDYHQGVIVYAMAMALQGGNAAARTISDADIDRIKEILNVDQRLSTTEGKVAVMESLKAELERRVALAEAYASGRESKVWAASTVERHLSESDYGGKSVIDVLYARHVNPDASSPGKSGVQSELPLTIPGPNGGTLYLQPNKKSYARTPHPDMNYDQEDNVG